MMSFDFASLANFPTAMWMALGVGLLFGTGAIWHRAGIQIFFRLIFPAVLVFGLATAATYVEVPGVDFDLSQHLPSLHGIEFDVAKAFGAGLIGAFVLRVLRHQALILQGQAGQRDNRRWRSARSVYYETAIRLGVLTADADGQAEPREFLALEDVFELTLFNAPNARKLYTSQLQAPRPMSRILAPFRKQFALASPPCETLILGMATIAAADGQPTQDELGLVRMAASLLGLRPADTNRLLDAAGIGEAAEQRLRQRGAHLTTLGLDPEATPKQITKTYKRLTSKYTPNRLLLAAIPDAERARVDALKVQLDRAYEALIPAP